MNNEKSQHDPQDTQVHPLSEHDSGSGARALEEQRRRLREWREFEVMEQQREARNTFFARTAFESFVGFIVGPFFAASCVPLPKSAGAYGLHYVGWYVAVFAIAPLVGVVAAPIASRIFEYVGRAIGREAVNVYRILTEKEDDAAQ